jgi:arabinogalactan endo-1,4-beta-galactosidase
MGYAATATPGDMNCTYQGPGKSGAGQFRIIAVVASSAEAEAAAKRMRDHQSRGSHDPNLAVVDSQGTVVFSIALFQHAATDSTASQLQKLVAAAKQHLAK